MRSPSATTTLPQRVVALDARSIDALQREIEERGDRSPSRARQPMAVDLREIVGALRVANDLERIGDLAKNIAKRVVALDRRLRSAELIRGVEHMADLVLGQVQGGARRYAAPRRRARRWQVWRGDEEIDAVIQLAVPRAPRPT